MNKTTTTSQLKTNTISPNGIFSSPGGGRTPGAIATNMRDTVLGTDLSVCKTSAKSVQQFRKCVPNRHTDRQTDRRQS